MFQDTEFQALLDENDAQTQQELAKQLGVAWSAISDCLKAMGKIQKERKWVQYELNERHRKTEKPSVKCYTANFKI